MCGIAGIAAARPVLERRWLQAASQSIQHRGPDGVGEWWSPDGCVGLGHRRLAIVDLSPAAAQPMRGEHHQTYIVFNGEIYNFVDLRRQLLQRGHSFRTESDTEVVLAAYDEWGTACVEHFNGMFALAIYDLARRRLFLARDRAGEKPLYYSCQGGALRFASELKGLMADPGLQRRIDGEALDSYLYMGFVPGEGCLLREVSKLPPAHAATYELDGGRMTLWRYWSLPQLQAPAVADAGELVEELEALLADAVRRQLVADVPVGVLLSGGTDSSIVTALAARAAAAVSTFTVRFPGHGKYDETEYARLIARHFGTRHTEIDAADCTVDLLPLLARQFDEPIVDSSMVPTYLISRVVRQHCTVALGGDGGDELFAGYRHYGRLLWLQQKLGAVPQFARRALAHAARALLPPGVKGRNWLAGLDVSLSSGVPLIACYYDRGARRGLLGNRADVVLSGETRRQRRMPVATDLLQRATRLDFENYLPEDILVKVDRASMLCSLEMRAPLLDHRVIEFAFGKVPVALKATAGARKILLRRLAARLLPREFDSQRKQGFSIPLRQWLAGGPWLDFFREVLLPAQDTFFDRRSIEALFAGEQRGRDNAERLFALVLFELWRREYRVSL